MSVSSTVSQINNTNASDAPKGFTGFLPEVSDLNLWRVAAMAQRVPNHTALDLLKVVYPYDVLCTGPARDMVAATIRNFETAPSGGSGSYSVVGITARGTEPFTADVNARHTSGAETTFAAATGTLPLPGEGAGAPGRIALTGSQSALLFKMLVSHGDADLCVLGPRGAGKTVVINEFARRLGYDVFPVLLHKDMTARDLVQQRGTLPNGDTVWKSSPLVTAAKQGGLAVLDGVNRVDASTITVLQRLAQDRELTLNDGTLLVAADRFEALKAIHGRTDAEMEAAAIVPIHPSFRMVAVGEAMQDGKTWINEELVSMFDIHTVAPLPRAEELQLIKTLCPGLEEPKLRRLFDVAVDMRAGGDNALGATNVTLSTRQLLKIARRMEKFPDGETMVDAVRRSSLEMFLPSLAKASLNRMLKEADAEGYAAAGATDAAIEAVVSESADGSGDKMLTIADVSARVLPAAETNELLVPSIRYYDNPQHTMIMRNMLKDLELGTRPEPVNNF